MKYQTIMFGDPAEIFIEVRNVDNNGIGFFSMCSRGYRIGDPDAVTMLAIQANWLGAAQEFHRKGWPAELAHMDGPTALAFLYALHFGSDADDTDPQALAELFGVDATLLADQDLVSYLHVFVAMHALGPPFDSFRCIIRPGVGCMVEIVHTQEKTGIRTEVVDSNAYRTAVSEFAAAFGCKSDIEKMALAHRRKWDAFRARHPHSYTSE
jgi:hypothetical protein